MAGRLPQLPGNFQFFKCAHAQIFARIVFQLLVGSESHPGKFPIAEILESRGSGLRHDFSGSGGRWRRRSPASRRRWSRPENRPEYVPPASTRRTPRCAIPRAKPPPSATPIVGRPEGCGRDRLRVGEFAHTLDGVLQPLSRPSFCSCVCSSTCYKTYVNCKLGAWRFSLTRDCRFCNLHGRSGYALLLGEPRTRSGVCRKRPL